MESMESTDKNGKNEQELASELRQKGWGVIHPTQFRIDMEEEFRRIWDRCEPYTMTSPERGYGLYQAVRYLLAANVPGDFVECGVWKGGSCMAAALTAEQFGDTRREIYLYDTFMGMPEPTEHDRVAWSGQKLSDRDSADFDSWAVGTSVVKENVFSTGYPRERFHFIEGKVEDTLSRSVPEQIALLRLDTDWYESTKAELEILYPKLVSGGVLIIDDYGHFTGAKKAVDEYFSGSGNPILLNRLDYTGRIGVKTG